MPSRALLRLVTLVALSVAGPVTVADQSRPTQEAPVTDTPLTEERLAGLYEARSVRVVPGDGDGGEPFDQGYRLLSPADPRPGTRYPLVVFLHGAGERGTDNQSQLKYLPAWLAEPTLRAAFPCHVLAPQCRPGRKWVETDWSAKESTPQAPPSPDMTGVIAALEATLAGGSVDPARVYLTGLSMGGYGSWDLAARMPDRFAALLPICGGGDEATAPKLAKLPIWCFHGDADRAVPVERSRSMIAAIRAAGGEPRYSELAGVGHDSWTPAYRDRAVLEWLFAQRAPAAK